LSIELYRFCLNIYWRSFWIFGTWHLQLISTRWWCYLMNGLFTKLFLLNFSDLIDWHNWVLLWSSVIWWYYFRSSAFNNILALLDSSRWLTVNWWSLEIFWVYLRLYPFVRNNWKFDSFCQILFELVTWVHFTPFVLDKWWAVGFCDCITNNIMNMIRLRVFERIEPLFLSGNKSFLHFIIKKMLLILHDSCLVIVVIWIVFWINLLKIVSESRGKIR
jgi:hypothetical protein